MSDSKPTMKELKERLLCAEREIEELKVKLRKSDTNPYSSELLEAVTLGANVIVAAVDNNFHYIYFNKAYKEEMKRLTGMDISIGVNMADYFIHIPEQQKIVIDEWSKVLGGETSNKRLVFGDPGIYRRVYYILHSPLRNTDGQVFGAGEVAYDITEQVKTEEELQAALSTAERKTGEFDAIMKSMPDGMIIFDKNGNQVFINDSARKFLESNPEHIDSALQDRAFISGAYRTDGTVLTYEESPVYCSLEKGEIVSNYEVIYGIKSGNPVCISITASPIRSKGGQISGAVLTFRDITGQKQVIEALRASDERFRLALKNAPVSVATQDINLRFLWAYNQRTGNSADIIGKTDAEIFIPEDAERLIPLKQRVIKTGEEISEKMWLTVNGKHRFIDLFLKPLRNETGQLKGVGIATVDLTEMKLAQEALKKSEKGFRSLAENAPDIIMRLDKNFRYVYVNSELNRAAGISPEKFIGKTGDELGVPARLCELLNKTYENAGKTKKIQEVDYEFLGLLGTRIYHARVLPELSEDGSVESFLSISRDITDEIKIKQELISTQNYLNKLLNYANAPIIVWNTEFRITMFNHAFEHLTDYKSEEVLGKQLNILFPENSREASMVKINQTLTGGQWEVVEIPIRARDGRISIVLWNSANIYAEDGNTHIATIAQGQDITERKLAEAELERTASFPKENPYPVMRVSKDGYLLFANPVSLPFLNEFNIKINDLIPANIREYVKQAINSGKNIEKELIIQDRIFHTTFAPIYTAGYVNIYAMDITKRKQAEEEIARAKGRLEERVQARTVQLKALALELSRTEQRERKRLAGILHDNLQQLLVSAKWSIQAAQKKNMDMTIQNSLSRTSELLDESINASKSIVAELSPPVLHQEGLVAALKWLSRWMGEKHGISVTINSDIEIEPDQEGICIMLFVSVRELLFNVLKHSGVKEASVSVYHKNNNIVIRVSDKGSGFDVSKSALHGMEGGFGLFSIREKIDLLGGKTIIKSSPGLGTSIMISTPASSAMAFNKDGRIKAMSPVQYAGTRKSVDELHGTKIRVILADDHAIMREGLRMMLDPVQDIEIVGEAQNGENAVEITRQLHPDIVIMDVNMPRMNGIEATRKITAEMPYVKVIGLSMHEEADLAGAMMKAGAVDYVHKASLSQELITCIRAHCRVPSGQ